MEALEQEAALTRSLLGRLTDDALSVRVAPGLRSLGDTAWHLPQSLRSIGEQVGLAVEAPDRDAPAPASAAEIMDAYETACRSLVAAVARWQDDDLIVLDDVYGESWVRGRALRVLLDHEIHHRGQCVVLMRQAGLEPPSLYGPIKSEVPDPFDEGPEAPVERLESRVRGAWVLENLALWLLACAGMVLLEVYKVPEWPWWPLPSGVGASVIAGCLLILCLLWPGLSYRRWRYRVRRHDVMLSHGVVWRVQRSVPRPRVQHVDVRSGPIDRAFGLAKCTLYTAGTGEADATIPGLRPEVAEALRERLLQDAADHV